jgi:ribonuclease R
MEVEREVIDLYRAFFLRDRIGDVFEGTISGVMGFGVFVVIDDPFVEGLVRMEALSDDYYIFDEPSCRLVGRRSGRTFALGDTVKVEVQSVSVVRRKVDFALHEHAHRRRERHAADHGGHKAGGARAERRRAATERAEKRHGAKHGPRQAQGQGRDRAAGGSKRDRAPDRFKGGGGRRTKGKKR